MNLTSVDLPAPGLPVIQYSSFESSSSHSVKLDHDGTPDSPPLGCSNIHSNVCVCFRQCILTVLHNLESETVDEAAPDFLIPCRSFRGLPIRIYYCRDQVMESFPAGNGIAGKEFQQILAKVASTEVRPVEGIQDINLLLHNHGYFLSIELRHSAAAIGPRLDIIRAEELG